MGHTTANRMSHRTGGQKTKQIGNDSPILLFYMERNLGLRTVPVRFRCGKVNIRIDIPDELAGFRPLKLVDGRVRNLSFFLVWFRSLQPNVTRLSSRRGERPGLSDTRAPEILRRPPTRVLQGAHVPPRDTVQRDGGEFQLVRILIRVHVDAVRP